MGEWGLAYVGFVCEFDEFEVDTPLNRVLKAAGAVVLASPRLSRELRRRARSLLLRMGEVGALRVGDPSTHVDRRTAHCADAFGLARHLLRSVGRALSSGDVTVWTFLVRTPELVEAGLRSLIESSIPEHNVVKRGLRLVPSAMTLNPDLVFGEGLSVADIKYKTATGEWKRGDLYQVVAFATGYRVAHAAIIDFVSAELPAMPDLLVGDVTVRHLGWPTDASLNPAEACAALVASVRTWLGECTDVVDGAILDLSIPSSAST